MFLGLPLPTSRAASHISRAASAPLFYRGAGPMVGETHPFGSIVSDYTITTQQWKWRKILGTSEFTTCLSICKKINLKQWKKINHKNFQTYGPRKSLILMPNLPSYSNKSQKKKKKKNPPYGTKSLPSRINCHLDAFILRCLYS